MYKADKAESLLIFRTYLIHKLELPCNIHNYFIIFPKNYPSRKQICPPPPPIKGRQKIPTVIEFQSEQ